MQFRYSTNWLAADVRSQVPGGLLAGEYALVCFVADDKAASPYDMVPVRFVRIIRAEQVGTSYILTLAADAFASGVTDAALRTSVNSADRAKLPSAAKAADELYAFTAHFNFRRHRITSFEAFEATAEQLSTHATFATEATAFFAVRQISKVSGRSWFGTWPQPSAVDQGAFNLKTGKRYECEVYCLRLFAHREGADGKRPPLKELALVAEANDTSLQFASAKRSVIDSRYDVKRFVFAAEPYCIFASSRRSSGRSRLARGCISRSWTRRCDGP